jgi:predicted RNase H-like HicB family nuclease
LAVHSFKSLNEYVEAALSTARFELIEEGKRFYAEVPNFKGVWAEGRTKDSAIKMLRQVLKGWVELELERGREIPAVKGGRLQLLGAA